LFLIASFVVTDVSVGCDLSLWQIGFCQFDGLVHPPCSARGLARPIQTHRRKILNENGFLGLVLRG